MTIVIFLFTILYCVFLLSNLIFHSILFYSILFSSVLYIILSCRDGVENSYGYLFYPCLFHIFMAWVLLSHVTILPAWNIRPSCLPIIRSVHDGHMASLSTFNLRGNAILVMLLHSLVYKASKFSFGIKLCLHTVKSHFTRILDLRGLNLILQKHLLYVYM